MSKRRHKGPRRPPGGIRLTTPEGDGIILASVRYQHAALEEIVAILRQADDFGLDDDLEPEPDGTFHFPWYETRPDAPAMFAPVGRRVLATLKLTPTELEVEAMSKRRMADCRVRLKRLLKKRIRFVEAEERDLEEALREREPGFEPGELFIPPPEVVAEIEDEMLRQWIDESIPALGGLTPREAAKTPEGREKLMDLFDYIERMQKRAPQSPGVFSPDYRRAKKMLGLE